MVVCVGGGGEGGLVQGRGANGARAAMHWPTRCRERHRRECARDAECCAGGRRVARTTTWAPSFSSRAISATPWRSSLWRMRSPRRTRSRSTALARQGGRPPGPHVLSRAWAWPGLTSRLTSRIPTCTSQCVRLHRGERGLAMMGPSCRATRRCYLSGLEHAFRCYALLSRKF